MLDVNPENVCRLIQLAQEIHAQEQVTIPEDTLDFETEDGFRQMLASHGNDMFLSEFQNIVVDLEPAQQCQLVALLWQGRGDFEFDEWPEAMQLAQEQWTPDTGAYLIKHPLLASYLRIGLEMHGYQCEIEEL